jgi:hypothetical protein
MSFLGSLLPSSQVNIAQVPQLPYEGAAARGAYGGIQSLGQYNLGGQDLGQYNFLTQQGVNDPNAAAYQAGAGTAGGMLEAAGQGAYGAGGSLMSTAQGLTPDVQALIQMGFDPQQALYARTANQTAQQQAAALAQSGVAGTPYGAGVAGQNMNNFNIDWQNAQLGRETSAAGAAGNLLGQIGQGVGTGAGLQTAGAQDYYQGAGLPYATSQGITGNQLGYLQGAAQFGQQASAIPQEQIGDWLNYINAVQRSQGLQQGAQSQQLAQAQQEFNQAQTLGTDLGKAAGWAGNLNNPFSAFFT